MHPVKQRGKDLHRMRASLCSPANINDNQPSVVVRVPRKVDRLKVTARTGQYLPTRQNIIAAKSDASSSSIMANNSPKKKPAKKKDESTKGAKTKSVSNKKDRKKGTTKEERRKN